MVLAKLFGLAFRNLGRNRRRTAITVLAIAFGLTMVHLMIGVQEGSYDAMIRQGVSALTGHVVVQERSYGERNDEDHVVTDTPAVVQAIRGRLPEAVVAPRLMLGGLLSSSRASSSVGLVGIDPVAEATVQQLDGKVVEGDYLEAGDERGILLGTELAKTLGVELGDRVVYMGQHGDATEMNSRLFRVSGLIRTGATELDAFGAFVDLAAAQDAWGVAGVSHRVTVHLPDPEADAEVAAAIGALLADRADLVALTWAQAMPELYGLIRLDRVSGDVMLVILGLIVAMGVLNTVLMSVLERTREFGVMLAIGLKPSRIAGVILLEGVALGLIGSGVGLGLGLLATWPLVVYGIDYSSFLGSDTMETGGITISTVLHARYAPWRIGLYSVGAVVFTTLAALYPAAHVARLEPVQAMRHV